MLMRLALAPILCLAACKAAPVPQSEMAGAAAADAAAWITITPGGDTLCATGTPYRFHVRPGDASRVMIFLNGGGACWSGELCDPSLGLNAYTPFAEMDANQPGTKAGAFDGSNPENPFNGWTQVFVSYCTGDAHLGGRDVTYPKQAGDQITVHHRGKANVQSVLDWVYANHPAPRRIFVGGGSAGAIASPFYAGLVADHYPQAEVIQYGGGAGGYRAGAVSGLLETWGTFDALPDWPEFAAFDRATFTIEDFFRVTAMRHPGMRMSQFNNLDDEVQQMFLGLMGVSEPVRGLIHANLEELAADIPGFRYFLAQGKDHTLLRYDRLYTTRTGDIRVVNWVRDLVEDKDVENVDCGPDNTCD